MQEALIGLEPVTLCADGSFIEIPAIQSVIKQIDSKIERIEFDISVNMKSSEHDPEKCAFLSGYIHCLNNNKDMLYSWEKLLVRYYKSINTQH